nr:hypothetical protein [Halomonas caseinilytica]
MSAWRGGAERFNPIHPLRSSRFRHCVIWCRVATSHLNRHPADQPALVGARHIHVLVLVLADLIDQAIPVIGAIAILGLQVYLAFLAAACCSDLDLDALAEEFV